MGIKIIRRILLIRLAVSFVIDYWKIKYATKRLQGTDRDEAVNLICSKAGKRMRLTAFRLKGIIVKVGQFLSLRQDLLPQAFTKELADLQDAMPSAPFSAVRPILEKEYNQKLPSVFTTFEEEAVAAASLAQVHRATLADGTTVAVKVIRPRMEKLAQADLDTLGIIAKVTQRFPSLRRKMNFVELHREFTETILRELDCLQELQHLRRFTEMFAYNQQLAVPKVYEDYSTQRVLVMEFVEGARITDTKQLSAWGVNRYLIAEALLEAYLRQVFVHGFIHLDPHPGNLLVLPDHRLCFLDFGMIDELSADEVKTLRSLLQNIMIGNVEGIIAALGRLGYIPLHEGDYLKPLIRQMLNRMHNAGDQTGSPELHSVVGGLRSFLHDSPIQLQAKYMFLIRGIGLLITSLSLLAPGANWFELLMRVGMPVFTAPIEAKE